LHDAKEGFWPSQFNVMLYKSDGTFVKSKCGSDFLFSLDNRDVVLTPGDYIVMVDPIWNQQTIRDLDY